MIVRLVLAGLVAVASVTTAPAAHAQEIGVAEGFGCGAAWSEIYNSELQYVELDGGPLVATTPGATISMTCTLQIGNENEAHSGADTFAASSPASPQVTAVAAVFPHAVPRRAVTFVCTQVTVDGVTYYRDGSTFTWSTDSAVPCDQFIRQDICYTWDFDCSPLLREELATADELFGDVADPVLCPLLGSLAPGVPLVKTTPEGDVHLSDTWIAWDCPPAG